MSWSRQRNLVIISFPVAIVIVNCHPMIPIPNPHLFPLPSNIHAHGNRYAMKALNKVFILTLFGPDFVSAGSFCVVKCMKPRNRDNKYPDPNLSMVTHLVPAFDSDQIKYRYRRSLFRVELLEVVRIFHSAHSTLHPRNVLTSVSHVRAGTSTCLFCVTVTMLFKTNTSCRPQSLSPLSLSLSLSLSCHTLLPIYAQSNFCVEIGTWSWIWPWGVIFVIACGNHPQSVSLKNRLVPTPHAFFEISFRSLSLSLSLSLTD
jgi:hypothetical protein